MGTICFSAALCFCVCLCMHFIFFFQAEDGIRDYKVTGVQTCALPIYFFRQLLLLSVQGRGAVSRFIEADGFLLSAGLAFFFLVCLIPILILGGSIMGFVLSTGQASRHIVEQVTQQFPVYQRQIARVLVRIVETRAVSSLLGTAVLVVASTPLFGACPLGLDRLLGVGGAALAGAVLASVLWEAAKQLFRLYVQQVGTYDQIYGPLGVLVAFVMFIYYSAIVFVFSGAFVAALDARHRRPPA